MQEITTDNILSLEIAEMMEIKHWQLLRKLEGRDNNGKHTKGYIDHLTDNQMVVSDFFIQTHYLDDSNKENKAYWFTKKGCEFIAHKMTGAKGTVFTARYINRFHEMEDVIKSRNEIAATVIPEKSPSLLPKASDWYKDNKEHLDWICANEKGMTVSRIYHIILKKCSMLYDMTAAEELYNKERGFYPKYPFDVVVYFPQLTEIADKMIHRMEIVIRARQKIGMEG